MPWCKPCKQFYNPNTLNSAGNCPSCGVLVERAGQTGETGETAKSALTKSPPEPARTEPALKVPWHFWLLCIATAGYLIWRLVQFGFRIF